jgi:type IV pilus biogenesis protein CpaD/CtpE
MRILKAVLTCLLLISLTACSSSPQKKVATKEMQTKGDARISLTNEYKECVIKAGGDKVNAKECDSYLEAIKKLK